MPKGCRPSSSGWRANAVFSKRCSTRLRTACWWWTRHGRVIYFNQAVTRLIGVQPDAEEPHVTKILPEVDWQKISRADHAGGAHVVRHEFEVHYPRPRFLRLYAAPLDGEAAGSSGVALILHDATEARQKTFEAIESERVQALTLLAASVAHEIGNPLNALHIHLQLMEREVKRLKGDEWRVTSGGKASRAPRVTRHPTPSTPPKNWSNISTWRRARSTGWITSSRNFSARSGPAPLQLKLVSLNEVVEKTLELLRPEMENRGIDGENANWRAS